MNTHRFEPFFLSQLTSRIVIALASLAIVLVMTVPAWADWILPPEDLTEVVDASTGERKGRILGTDGSGNVHAVWIEQFSGGSYSGVERVFYRRRPIGSMWDPDPFVIVFSNTANWLKNPSLYVMTDGRVHVVWQQIISGNWDIFYRLYQPGPGWSPSINLSSDVTNSTNPKVAGDLAGNAYALWFDSGTLQSKKFTFGVGWDVSPTRLDSVGASFPADIVVDHDGTVYAAWSELVTGTTEAVSKRRTQTGSWDSFRTPISPVDGNFSNQPALTVDSAGDVHAVYLDNRSGGNNVYHRRRIKGSGWESTDRVVSAGSANGPQVAADSVGKVHVTWVQETVTDLFYRRYESGAFDFSRSDSVVTGDVSGTVSSNQANDVAAAPWGTPQVAFQVGPVFGRQILFKEEPSGLRQVSLDGVPPDIESGVQRIGSTETGGTYVFDTPDPSTIRKAILVFSHANFDWIVDVGDPYPNVARDFVGFNVLVDDSLKAGYLSQLTSFQKVELDITGHLKSTDSTRVRFERISGDDDALIVLPTLTIWDTLGTLVSVPAIPVSQGGILLRPAIPNPFAGGTMLNFELPQPASSVTLDVYDVRGRRVKRLLDGVGRVAGYHSVPWDGSSDSGARAPAGVYYYKLVINGRSEGAMRAVRVQ